MSKEKEKNKTKEVPLSMEGYLTYAVVKGGGKLLKLADSTDIVTERRDSGIAVACKGTKKEISFIPRGTNNNLPGELLQRIGKNVTVGSNVDHKTNIVVGDGISVYRKVVGEGGKVEKAEVSEDDYPDIFRFMEDNDYELIRQEIANDLVIYNEAFVKYFFSREDKPKLVQVKSQETSCSRISELDEKSGKSEWHGYSAEWGESSQTDVVATPLLDRQASLHDLQRRLGMVANEKGLKEAVKERVFVQNLRLPTPGRFYYSKPSWWSVFASGWYDFSAAIPVYKKALIKNQMALRYIVYIREEFWDKLFRMEQATDSDKRSAVKRDFLTTLESFLAGEENAGKGFVTEFKYDKIKGYEEKDIIIEAMENKQLSGGEYIEDSEEVSNTICYAMGVHPSLIGASPGKGKNINGTEARELFIIEQSMMRRYQKLTLAPLYVAKKVNGWPSDIYFDVINCQLTTLDKGTGAVKNIGMSNE